MPYSPDSSDRSIQAIDADYSDLYDEIYHFNLSAPAADPSASASPSTANEGSFNFIPVLNPNASPCNDGIYTLITPKPWLDAATFFIYTATETVATTSIDCEGCDELVKVAGLDLKGHGPVRIFA